MLKRTLFYVAATLLLLAPGYAQESLLAPLPVRDQFLLGNGFFFFEPEGARVLDDGDSSFDIHNSTSNTFAKSAWISRNLAGETAGRLPGHDTVTDPRYAWRDTVFLI